MTHPECGRDWIIPLDVHVRAQSCPAVRVRMDCSPPGSFVHGILQARILEWVSIHFSKGILLTQGLNPYLLRLLHQQADSLLLSHRGSIPLDTGGQIHHPGLPEEEKTRLLSPLGHPVEPAHLLLFQKHTCLADPESATGSLSGAFRLLAGGTEDKGLGEEAPQALRPCTHLPPGRSVLNAAFQKGSSKMWEIQTFSLSAGIPF